MTCRGALVAVALTVLVGAAAVAAALDLAGIGAQPYEPPRSAPAFTLPDLDGQATRLEDLRGKVVLLYFWTTW